MTSRGLRSPQKQTNKQKTGMPALLTCLRRCWCLYASSDSSSILLRFTPFCFSSILALTFVMLNRLIVLLWWNSSDPKGKFHFMHLLWIIKFFCTCVCIGLYLCKSVRVWREVIFLQWYGAECHVTELVTATMFDIIIMMSNYRTCQLFIIMMSNSRTCQLFVIMSNSRCQFFGCFVFVVV